MKQKSQYHECPSCKQGVASVGLVKNKPSQRRLARHKTLKGVWCSQKTVVLGSVDDFEQWQDDHGVCQPMKPRAPQNMINKLREIIGRLEKGPCRSHIGSSRLTVEEALKEAHDNEHNWRESWINPELRQILSYLEGKHTAAEIEVYGQGHDYK